MATWTYEGYWNAVLGASRDAANVVSEFELDASDRRGIDEWLGVAEVDAWMAGGGEPHRDALPTEWTEWHAKALNEIVAVA